MGISGFLVGLGLFVALMIFLLIRRDRLVVMHSVWWLGIALMIVVLALFPELVDLGAKAVGITYPPSLLFMSAILILVIKLLLSDIDRSHDRRRLLLLAQKVSMLEAKLKEADSTQINDE